MALNEIDGRRCLRLTGDVRLENNGGFIQMARRHMAQIMNT